MNAPLSYTSSCLLLVWTAGLAADNFKNLYFRAIEQAKYMHYFSLIFKSAIFLGVTLVMFHCGDVYKDIGNKESWMYYLGYVFIVNGLLMACMKGLHYYQMNKLMAPIVATVKSVLRDIILMTFMFWLVGLSLGLGLFFVGQLSEDTCPSDSSTGNDVTKNNVTMPFSLEAEDNQFKDVHNTLKVAFWSVFDNGHPEVIGCTNGLVRKAAQTMWMLYQVLRLLGHF